MDTQVVRFRFWFPVLLVLSMAVPIWAEQTPARRPEAEAPAAETLTPREWPAAFLEKKNERPINPWAHYSAPRVLASGSSAGSARSLGTADFDEDGVQDLVASFGNGGNGRIEFHRGSGNALYGKAGALPFTSQGRSVFIPTDPDFLGTGDFNADGHFDIVVARAGADHMFWLAGDGRGNFETARIVALDGTLTAFLTSDVNRRDFLEDVVVGILGENGPAVAVYESPSGAFQARPEIHPMPDTVTALAAGRLERGSSVDIAAGAGNQLVIIEGRDRKLSWEPAESLVAAPAVISQQTLSFSVAALVVGNFQGDFEEELAVLSRDGGIQILEADSRAIMRSTAPLHSLNLSSDALLLQGKGIGGGYDFVLASDARSQGLRAYSAQFGEAYGIEASVNIADAKLMRLNVDAVADLVILDRDTGSLQFLPSAPLLTFVVDSVGDGGDSNTADGACNDGSGKCTLRAAIQQANATPALDNIHFNIPGAGVQTILPNPYLDPITAPVVIDGTTQPGASSGVWPPTLLIELDGSKSNFGLMISATAAAGSVIRGMIVNRCNGEFGNGIYIANANNSIVEYNLIGTDPTGTIDMGNGTGMTLIDVTGVLVGGTTPGSRNLISGNEGGFNESGIHIQRGSGNTVSGNYIGTDVTGTTAISNGEWGGVFVFFIAHDHVIGGVTAGSGNVISGNSVYGVLVYTSPPGINTGNSILGNIVGLNASGTAPLGNELDGIRIDYSEDTTVGGINPNARNIVSDHRYGILVNSGSTNALIQGNLIGTDINGVLAFGNLAGVGILNSVQYSVVGGTVPQARNVIAGGTSASVFVNSVGDSFHTVQGNLIGTDITGMNYLGTGAGVGLSNNNYNLVGGATSAARNIISGASFAGVYMTGESSFNTIRGNYIGTNILGTGSIGNGFFGVGAFDDGDQMLSLGNYILDNLVSGNGTGGPGEAAIFIDSPLNVIQGNRIGVAVNGTSPLPNLGEGIWIWREMANNNIIGGTTPGEGNIVAFNDRNGIMIGYTGIAVSQPGNRILGNLIFDNGLLGIDLNQDGVTANDLGDGDTGSNESQNFPVLASAAAIPGFTKIEGSLNSLPNSIYTLEFFASPTCDESGHGQGRIPVGYLTVTTDAFGDASFAPIFPVVVPQGYVISATATDVPGNTSEFSACECVAPLVVAAENGPVCEGNTLHLSASADPGGTYSWSGPDGFTSTLQNPFIENVTPDAAGTYTVEATINACTSSVSITVNVNPKPTLTPETLPNGTFGDAYSETVVASGGSGPYQYAVTSGTLPDGLSMSTSGQITGTPTANGSFNFTVTATDSGGCAGSLQYSIVINAAPVALDDLYNATEDSALIVPADDGVLDNDSDADADPLTAAIVPGSEPIHGSLTLNTDGSFTYTPEADYFGTDSFQYRASDGLGESNIGTVTINISDAAECLFADDFEDDVVDFSKWTVLKDLWTESGGQFVGTPTGKAAIVVAGGFSGCSGNCSIDTYMQTDGGLSNMLVLLGWYQDKRNSVELLMKEDTNKWVLRQKSNGKVISKQGLTANIEPNVSYHIQLSFDGTNFVLMVDGNLLITLPSGAVPTGRAGFLVKKTTGRFSGICVK